MDLGGAEAGGADDLDNASRSMVTGPVEAIDDLQHEWCSTSELTTASAVADSSGSASGQAGTAPAVVGHARTARASEQPSGQSATRDSARTAS